MLRKDCCPKLHSLIPIRPNHIQLPTGKSWRVTDPGIKPEMPRVRPNVVRARAHATLLLETNIFLLCFNAYQFLAHYVTCVGVYSASTDWPSSDSTCWIARAVCFKGSSSKQNREGTRRHLWYWRPEQKFEEREERALKTGAHRKPKVRISCMYVFGRRGVGKTTK